MGVKQAIGRFSLIQQIIVAMILGAAVGYAWPAAGKDVAFLGSLFTKALKAVAPILVFTVVLSALANSRIDTRTNVKKVLVLYVTGTMLASLAATTMGMAFPVRIDLNLAEAAAADTAPTSIGQVLIKLLENTFSNPVAALVEANFLGILAWGVILGLTFRKANQETRTVIGDLADGVNSVVRFVIMLAPIGIFGIVAGIVSAKGFGVFVDYGKLILVLVGAMLFVAFLMNPAMVCLFTRKNPYPLVWQTITQSGLTAFFTRSSAANIPVNMALCERMKLNHDTYSITIPLGATINMAGAAVTITVMTLAACHSLGIPVSFAEGVILSFLAALGACGASGVAGGSLLLIPLACSMFSMPDTVAPQLIAIGLMIGVIQDSCETALNSSSDVLFTAAAEQWAHRVGK